MASLVGLQDLALALPVRMWMSLRKLEICILMMEEVGTIPSL